MSTREGSIRRRHARGCKRATGGRCRCTGGWRYRARTHDGRRVERSGFATREAAEVLAEVLGEVLGEARRGGWREPTEPVDFTTHAEEWLATVKPTVRRRPR